MYHSKPSLAIFAILNVCVVISLYEYSLKCIITNNFRNIIQGTIEIKIKVELNLTYIKALNFISCHKKLCRQHFSINII